MNVLSYKDDEPCFDLCVRVQEYFEQHKLKTRVKIAGLLTSDQAIELAGAQTMTIAPAVLKSLSESQDDVDVLAKRSLYGGNSKCAQDPAVTKYGNDEAGWKEAFNRSDNGKGAAKTAQAIGIFSEYQLKGEDLLREAVNKA